jgi:exoribonuclease II
MTIFEENAPNSKIKLASSRDLSPSYEADKQNPARLTAKRGQTVRSYLLKSELAVIDQLKTTQTRKAEIEDLIRIGISVKLGKKHADVLLPPVISAIRKEQAHFSNRWMHIFAELHYTVEFTRLLLVEFVRSINPKLVQEIEAKLTKRARTNL